MVSLALYIVSLCLPALEFRTQSPVRGLTALLWGWWGVVTKDFPWFANPAYFLSLLLAYAGKQASSLLLCGLAIGLGFLSVFVREWYFNEAGGTPVERLGAAFYVWMASFVALFAGVCWWGFMQRKRCEQLDDAVKGEAK